MKEVKLFLVNHKNIENQYIAARNLNELLDIMNNKNNVFADPSNISSIDILGTVWVKE